MLSVFMSAKHMSPNSQIKEFLMFKKLLLAVAILFLPVVVFADVNCPKAKVLHLQPQIGSILVYQEGQNWHNVGNPESAAVQAMYSALLAAQMADKPVIIRYPDGCDCTAYELETAAKMVRTYNE